MKRLLFLLLLGLVAGCTSSTVKNVQCDLEDGLEGTIAYGIETLGQCTGVAAVRASVNSWVDSANVCPNDATHLKAMDSANICGLITGALASAVQGAAQNAINSKFPEWQCNPTMAISALQTLASLACSAVFPSAAPAPVPVPIPSR